MGILGKVIVGAILFGFIGSFFGGIGTIIGIILGIITGVRSDQDANKKIEKPKPIEKYIAELKNAERTVDTTNLVKAKSAPLYVDDKKDIASANDIETDKDLEKDDDYW